MSNPFGGDEMVMRRYVMHGITDTFNHLVLNLPPKENAAFQSLCVWILYGKTKWYRGKVSGGEHGMPIQYGQGLVRPTEQ